MSGARYLRHLTLQTGHVRDSPRGEVSEEAVAVCTELLSRARVGPAPIPGVEPACTLRVTRAGRCLLATVCGPEDAPLLTIGVAGHSRCGARLWRLLHEGRSELKTDPRRCPPEPWVADRLENGMAIYLSAAEWTGDFSRCCAWAAL